MAFDASNTPDPYDGVRRIAERVAKHLAERDEAIRQAKGGNPLKLVSERDLHAINFARISASLTKREG